KIRAELGISPGMGNSYPGFWGRVGQCLKNAGAGASPQTQQAASRRTLERPSEQNTKDRPAPANNEKQTAAPSRPRTEKPERLSGPKIDSPDKATALVHVPALAKSANVAAFGRRVALIIGNGKYEH